MQSAIDGLTNSFYGSLQQIFTCKWCSNTFRQTIKLSQAEPSHMRIFFILHKKKNNYRTTTATLWATHSWKTFLHLCLGGCIILPPGGQVTETRRSCKDHWNQCPKVQTSPKVKLLQDQCVKFPQTVIYSCGSVVFSQATQLFTSKFENNSRFPLPTSFWETMTLFSSRIWHLATKPKSIPGVIATQ